MQQWVVSGEPMTKSTLTNSVSPCCRANPCNIAFVSASACSTIQSDFTSGKIHGDSSASSMSRKF